MKKTAVLIMTVFFLAALPPVLEGEAFEFAGPKACKSVRLVVTNGSGLHPIKVYSIHHYDYEAKKWRVSKTFLPRYIKAHSDWHPSMINLKYVKNKKTKIQISYKKGVKRKRRGYKYSGKKKYWNSYEFTCSDYDNRFLTVK